MYIKKLAPKHHWTSLKKQGKNKKQTKIVNTAAIFSEYKPL
jgi:hypothetical protein